MATPKEGFRYRVIQYRPTYFEGFDTAEDDCADEAAVLALPYVARLAARPEFVRFELIDHDPRHVCCEDGGHHTMLAVVLCNAQGHEENWGVAAVWRRCGDAAPHEFNKPE